MRCVRNNRRISVRQVLCHANVPATQLTPRLRPDRFLLCLQSLHVSHSDRKMGTRGVGALAHHSCRIRLGSLRPMSRAHADCYDGIWILYSAGQPCLNPMYKWADGPDFVHSRWVLRQTDSPVESDVKEAANILRFLYSASLFQLLPPCAYLSFFSRLSFSALNPAKGFASSSDIALTPGSENTVVSRRAPSARG